MIASEVTVHIHEINKGFVRPERVPVSGGQYSLNPSELAATAGVQTDGHMAVRQGRGLGLLRGTYQGAQSLPPTDNEVSVFLRPPGPRYALVSTARLFSGQRVFGFGFKSANGIVGPATFWPTVFGHLDRAFTAEDGLKYLGISFNPATTGSLTAGFYDASYGSLINTGLGTIEAHAPGSNSRFPQDYDNWNAVGQGCATVWLALFLLSNPIFPQSAHTLIFGAAAKFTEEGLALSRDVATRL